MTKSAKTYKMIVFTNPVEGRDEAYNDWYSTVHIQDVLRIPGVIAAQRFKRRAGADRWGYVALYDLETDDPEALIPEIKRRTGEGVFNMSDAISFVDVYSGIFEPVTDIVRRD